MTTTNDHTEHDGTELYPPTAVGGTGDCPAPSCSPIVATVEWIRGNRFVSDFMANAGLGLSGVGVKERVKIIYKPGEQVDEARVLKAVSHMIREAEETNADFKISCPKVISISGANVKDQVCES